VNGVLTNEEAKEGHPLKDAILPLLAFGLSRVKMVADERRHAAYHNKNWRRAS